MINGCEREKHNMIDCVPDNLADNSLIEMSQRLIYFSSIDFV